MPWCALMTSEIASLEFIQSQNLTEIGDWVRFPKKPDWYSAVFVLSRGSTIPSPKVSPPSSTSTKKVWYRFWRLAFWEIPCPPFKEISSWFPPRDNSLWQGVLPVFYIPPRIGCFVSELKNKSHVDLCICCCTLGWINLIPLRFSLICSPSALQVFADLFLPLTPMLHMSLVTA